MDTVAPTTSEKRPKRFSRLTTVLVAVVLAVAVWWALDVPIPFHPALWKRANPNEINFVNRLQMAKYLVWSGSLVGKTRAEVEQLLGPSAKLFRIELAEALAEAFKRPRTSGPWDDAMGYALSCSGTTFYTSYCSELGVKLDSAGRVVEAKIFDRQAEAATRWRAR
jgi:hypothetical protein